MTEFRFVAERNQTKLNQVESKVCDQVLFFFLCALRAWKNIIVFSACIDICRENELTNVVIKMNYDHFNLIN